MMPTHAVTCQFRRDPASEHLASSPIEVDAEAVLFSWTDQEGRSYQVLLREGDRLVATLHCDGLERVAATEELGRQRRALGLIWEAASPAVETAWSSPAADAGSVAPHGPAVSGGVHHGH